MTPEELQQRRLRMFGQFVLRLLVEERDWSEAVLQRIEDTALDYHLMESDDEGNYRLINS